MINWISSSLKIASIYSLLLQTIFVPGFSYAQTAETESMSACASNPSTSWDSSRNRCVTQASAVNDRQEYLECTDTSKYSTEESRKACHDKYAKDRAKTEQMSGVFEGLAWGGVALNVILAAVMLINSTGENQEPKGCTPKTIIKYTAIANVLFELYYQFMAKKALDDLQENYEKSAVNEDPYEAQVAAFKFLKDEQKEIKKLAELRFKQYAVSTVGYGAAGILAAIASADVTGSQYAACTGAEADADAEAEPAEAEPAADAEAEPAEAEPAADAADTDTATATADSSSSTTAGTEAAASNGLTALFNSLTTLIILCTVMTLYNGFLGYMAKKESDKAGERSDAIEDIIAKFKSSVDGYCPSGRDSMNEPRCYCYKDGGGKNMDRTNSETCQALWAKDSQNFFVAGSDYSTNKTNNPKGCMTRDGKFDQKCQCKKFKDANGQNACYKVPAFSNITLPGLANATNGLGRTVNSLTNGALSPADVNTAKLTKSAASLNRLRGKVLKSLNKTLAKRGEKGIKLMSGKQALKFAKKLASKKALASASKRNLSNLSSAGSTTNPSLLKAIKEAKKMSGLSFGGGKGLNKRKRKKKGGFKLDFGNNRRGGKSGAVKTFMAKDYNYKDNDIVDRDDVSIFQVISNRYNTSGLRLLFDE
ncbi:MAG: hypothetical protein HN576_10930 [Bacteriovoracaceae bacterium]|nr:hypothetical protein [Bacteriovoracaceae bacterium]